MYKTLAADKLVKVLAGLLLALLTYEAKCLCEKVDALERTQNRICVRLGIEPVAVEYPGNWGLLRRAAASPENQDNQKSAASQNNYEFSP